MNENYKKAQRLIKEGYTNTQDKLADVMMGIKKDNPNLTHKEIMNLFQEEVERFMKFHKMDTTNVPNTPFKQGNNNRIIRDRMPMMKIPYGDKIKKV